MRVILPIAFFVASVVPAYAGVIAVPEIDALAGFSAMAVIGSIGAWMWERRGRKH